MIKNGRDSQYVPKSLPGLASRPNPLSYFSRQSPPYACYYSAHSQPCSIRNTGCSRPPCQHHLTLPSLPQDPIHPQPRALLTFNSLCGVPWCSTNSPSNPELNCFMTSGR
jgi:hypothetical protein